MGLSRDVWRFLRSLPSDCSWVDTSKIGIVPPYIFRLVEDGYVEIQAGMDWRDDSIAITPLGLKAIGRKRKKSRAPKSPAKSPMHSP